LAEGEGGGDGEGGGRICGGFGSWEALDGGGESAEMDLFLSELQENGFDDVGPGCSWVQAEVAHPEEVLDSGRHRHELDFAVGARGGGQGDISVDGHAEGEAFVGFGVTSEEGAGEWDLDEVGGRGTEAGAVEFADGLRI
jgi:hypothetical protein